MDNQSAKEIALALVFALALITAFVGMWWLVLS